MCDERVSSGRPPPARAHEALARIRRLYDIEADARGLDDAGRLAKRQGCARPVLDALFT